MFEELTFVREEIKEHSRQVTALRHQLMEQQATLTALKEIHSKLNALEARLGARTASDLPLASPPPPRPDVAGMDYSRMIQRTGPSRFRIERAAVDHLLSHPRDFAMGARIVPATQNGRPSGFKLFAIRPGSLYLAMGLRNGDTVEEINGYSMTSPDLALEAYTRLRKATRLSVKIRRSSELAPLTLEYILE